jgi:hypothetical protein
VRHYVYSTKTKYFRFFRLSYPNQTNFRKNKYKTDGGQWKIFLRIFLRILKIFFGGRWKGGVGEWEKGRRKTQGKPEWGMGGVGEGGKEGRTTQGKPEWEMGGVGEREKEGHKTQDAGRKESRKGR